jgi:hypothetical protein
MAPVNPNSKSVISVAVENPQMNCKQNRDLGENSGGVDLPFCRASRIGIP